MEHQDIKELIFFLWDSDCGDHLWHWWMDRVDATEELGLPPFYSEDESYSLYEQIEEVEAKWDEADSPWQFVWQLEQLRHWAKDCVEDREEGYRTPGHEDYDEEIASWTHTSDDLKRWTINQHLGNSWNN